MPSYEVDTTNISSVKRVCNLLKAEHITKRILDVLDDYYRDSGVEIYNETDLPALITSEIQTCLYELE